MQTKSIIIAILIMVITVLSAAAETAPPDKKTADVYLENLLKGDYEACYLMSDKEMQDAMSPEKLQEIWETLPVQVGEYIGVIQTSKEVKEPYHIYTYALNFEKMVLDMKVTLDDKGVVSGFYLKPSSVEKPGAKSKLPEYLSPDMIVADEIEFDCEGMQVSGMLTLPAKADSYPVVLLLTGSGPNDMDETVGARKPFRDLANGLANQGIATLRWNKRTRDYPEKFSADESITVRDEYLPELIAAMQWLDENQDDKISGYYVLGHSMGGFILPMAATETKGISGYIMLAANARPLEDLVLEQYNHILGQDGLTDDEKADYMEIQQQVKDVKKLSADKPAPDKLLLGAPKSYWLSLNDYHQVEVFSSLDVPFLILQGAKDYQVSNQDFEMWRTAAKDKKQVSLTDYPDLDHLFMYCEGVSTPDSYLEPAFVSEEVIKDIADWIKLN